MDVLNLEDLFVLFFKEKYRPEIVLMVQGTPVKFCVIQESAEPQ